MTLSASIIYYQREYNIIFLKLQLNFLVYLKTHTSDYRIFPLAFFVTFRKVISSEIVR